jgi:hypothetical protein
VTLPKTLAEATRDHLRYMGRRGFEGFVLWAGELDGKAFRVTHTVVPEQHAVKTDDGVYVQVKADELHRLNVWLYESRRLLLAQIHSHPTDAYHSETDDAYPIAVTAGCFSLVVPDFAVRPFSFGDCAVYRLSTGGLWEELSSKQVSETFSIVE